MLVLSSYSCTALLSNHPLMADLLCPWLRLHCHLVKLKACCSLSRGSEDPSLRWWLCEQVLPATQKWCLCRRLHEQGVPAMQKGCLCRWLLEQGVPVMQKGCLCRWLHEQGVPAMQKGCLCRWLLEQGVPAMQKGCLLCKRGACYAKGVPVMPERARGQ